MPPPAGRSSQFAVLQFLHVYACCKCRRVVFVCIKRVENSLRTVLGLFHWSRTVSCGQWFDLHIILPCSLTAGGRSLAARLPAMFCNMYMANNSSILQYCHSMSIEGVVIFYRTTELHWSQYAKLGLGAGGGGGLNCEAKAHVLIVTPPLFFLEVGRKRGGHNSGAVR